MFCPTCSCEFGPVVFCPVCQKYLPAPAVGRRPTFARRAFAILIDAVTLLLFVMAALWTGRFFRDGGRVTMVVLVVACVVYVAAFVRGLSSGRTVGKLALGLQTYDMQDGRIPNVSRMLLRETVLKALGALALGVGYFSALRDADGQAWHDKLAGTVVVAPARREEMAASTKKQVLWPLASLAALLLLVVSGLLAPVLQRGQKDGRAADARVTAQPAAQRGANLEAFSRPRQAAAKPSAMDVASTTIQPRPRSASTLAQRAPDANTVSQQTLQSSRQDSPLRASPVSTVAAPDPAREVEHFLTNWSSAEADAGARQIGYFYAEDVNRYFLRRNVTRDYVVADHQAYLDRGRRARFFHVTNLRFDTLSANAASLSVVKTWDEVSRDETSATQKSTRSRLWLQRFPEGWKIVGEQDLRTP